MTMGYQSIGPSHVSAKNVLSDALDPENRTGLTCMDTRTIGGQTNQMSEVSSGHIASGIPHKNASLTVNPKGNICPFFNIPGVSPVFDSMNVFRHSAQKSNNFCPSSCFCSSVRRYLVCVSSNLPWPCSVTRQTRRLVPPSNAHRDKH